ncbi:MAG TPA: dienelactone hydrolase family protein [Caulobacteraceae bacterium]|nr:dienelactone hydrolase family protein [Caulobacteraceae bacterium]
MTDLDADLAQSQVDSLHPKQGFSRRGFAMTSLGVGFALAAQPVSAQTVIVTDAVGLAAGEVKVPVADGAVPAYRAYPAGKKGAPVVLVIHEVFGVHEHIKDLCRRLAKAGYYAISPDLYARYGDATKVADMGALMQLVGKASDEQVRGDLDAAVRFAAEDGADVKRLAVTGFCWGGRQSWLYTEATPGVKAAAAWYGPLGGAKTPVANAAAVKGRMIGFYGGQDRGITQEQRDAMTSALQAAGDRDSKIIVYEDAGHGFNADYRASYNGADAKDAWAKMLAWFKAHGVA